MADPRPVLQLLTAGRQVAGQHDRVIGVGPLP